VTAVKSIVTSGVMSVALVTLGVTSASAANLSRVEFSGTVTETFNIDPQQVKVGDTLAGSFIYDTNTIVGRENPSGPEQFPLFLVTDLELNVGNVSGTLNPFVPFSFFVPGLLNSVFNNVGAFFNSNSGELFAFNAGAGNFSIVGSSGAVVGGTYQSSIVSPPASIPEPTGASALLGFGLVATLGKLRSRQSSCCNKQR